MKNLIFILLLISMFSVGCSAKKTNQKESNVDLTELDDTSIEDVEADSISPLDSEMLAETEPEQEELTIEESDESYSLFGSSNEEVEVAIDTSESEDDDEVLIAEAQEQEEMVQDQEVNIIEETSSLTKVIENSEYVIQKNDTLMLVAWKIYGDYTKWRELEKLNQDKIHGRNIWIGEKLTFERPEVEFNWSPEGSPYLLKQGDTLGRVSNNVYETPKHWKLLWYNNRDLIRNPDLIFAGFTIYYKDLELINEREIASKMRMFKKEK